MKKGFTLIELLVVVLIIGILSAVALPQYEKAVKKSRVMSMVPVARALKDAQEIYYMANGNYAIPIEDLDVTIPSSCEIANLARKNEFTCDGIWLYDNHVDDAAGSIARAMTISYCPGLAQNSASCKQHKEYFRFFWYYDHADYSDKYRCQTSNTKGQEMCKMLEQIFSN